MVGVTSSDKYTCLSIIPWLTFDDVNVYLADMKGVAMLASDWGIPVFGWLSNDHDLADRSIYTTLVRLLAPLNQFCK